MMDLEPILAMFPPSVAASLRVVQETIPRLGEAVQRGEMTPEEAGYQLGTEMIPTFQAMKDEAE